MLDLPSNLESVFAFESYRDSDRLHLLVHRRLQDLDTSETFTQFPGITISERELVGRPEREREFR